MQKFYSKYRRGDVWFLKFYTERGDGNDSSSVQKKSRPYVIVSCEENNNNAPTFNVCPISSRDNDHLPPHVYFRYEDGTESARNQLVFCEQITTVSVQDFLRSGSYFMYSFSVEFMDKIDTALAAQLGLQIRVADMHVLESLIDKLAAQKLEDIQRLREKALESRVNDLAAKLARQFHIDLDAQDLLNGLTYTDKADTIYTPKDVLQQMKEAEAERTTAPKVEKSYHKLTVPKLTSKSELTAPPKINAVPLASPPAAEPTKVKYKSWTLDMKKQFLDDYKRLSLKDIQLKYDMKKSTIQTNACKFRKELGIR